ncbi:MAG: pyruvate kinase [Pseudomonadota bacterium]
MPSAPLTIIATLGPATPTPAAIAALMEAGAGFLRINGSHVRPGQLAQALDLAAQGGFAPAQIVLDLQGGKTRLGWLAASVEVRAGQRLTLVPTAVQGIPNPEVLAVDRASFLRSLAPGDTLRVDDGRLELVVLAAHGTRVTAEALGPGALGPRMGLARAGGGVDGEVHLLASDRTLLDHALPRGVTTLALSCAEDPELLRLVRRHARRVAPDLPVRVVAKLETGAGLAAWQPLGAEADALWLCRGDLGAELGLTRFPAAQRRLLAEALPSTPLLVAGEVLYHMTVGPRPTRSELSHVADLIAAGVAGFVFSDETALGPHGPEAVGWIRRIEAGEATSA